MTDALRAKDRLQVRIAECLSFMFDPTVELDFVMCFFDHPPDVRGAMRLTFMAAAAGEGATVTQEATRV